MEDERVLLFEEECKTREDLEKSEVRLFRCLERGNETALRRVGHQVQHHCIHSNFGCDKSGSDEIGGKIIERVGG